MELKPQKHRYKHIHHGQILIVPYGIETGAGGSVA